VPRSRRTSHDETSRYRFTSSDLFAVLLLVGWCVLGIVKISHDVSEYHAQQAAMAAFATRYPAATLRLFPQPGAPSAEALYDPASGQWLLGEVAGYLLTLVVVAVGCKRVRRRRVNVEVKWIETPGRRAATQRRATAVSSSGAAPGNVAADRLSVIIWNDHVARLEKERA
jgi:hypothetical protein